MTRRTALAAFACAGRGFAEDFWKVRPASEWSEKDAARLRSNSPWAHTAGVEMMGGGMRPRGGGGGGGGRRGGGGGMPGGGSSEGGGGGAGVEMGDSQPPMPEVTVRWESAKPMQAAAARVEAPLADRIAKASEQFYVLSASGIPAMAIGRGSGDPAARLQAVQARLKDSTVLKRKGKPDLHAEQAAIVKGPKGLMFVFAFPRSETIEEADKEVIFESNPGAMKLKTKFALKNMTYTGGLSL